MSEQAENARKKLVDGLAETFLHIDEKGLSSIVDEVVGAIREHGLYARVVVCGGAGANKTTFANVLSAELGAPTFDFDEYIPGGYTPDRMLYDQRFAQGLERLWEDLPVVRSWIVEHVEACNRDLVKMIHPSVAVHLNPGIEHLKSVAQARDLVGKNTNGGRHKRALETAIRAKMQFEGLRGKIILRGKNFEVKVLEEG
jgi:hypothetical protein